MYRSHNNGELRLNNVGEEICLSGWVQKVRDKGFMIWVDLRDRYGITQLIFDGERTDVSIVENARSLGREFVIQVKGKVIEREAKNNLIPTGAIEILVTELSILNESKVPPFTIENETLPLVLDYLCKAAPLMYNVEYIDKDGEKGIELIKYTISAR